MKITTVVKVMGFAALLEYSGIAMADGIVSKIVNSPLSAAGTVKSAPAGINVYLQSDEVQGIEFMNPIVEGYGIPAGGRIEIEMGNSYQRNPEIKLTQNTIMLVTGAPQQGMPGKVVGYAVGEGRNQNNITITPTSQEGLNIDKLISPAPGAKLDPVPSHGIKVIHVGFFESAFSNGSNSGSVSVRIIDGSGSVVQQGSASIDFIDQPVPQLQPSNFPNANRNHNWQVIASGETLGKTPGTLPIPATLYAKAKGINPTDMGSFKAGMLGVGILSTQQLKAMKFKKPASLSRYNGGLIVQDTNNDGRIDPNLDKIVGGVIGKAPAGAKGQELRSLDVHGAVDLSRPTSAYNAKFGPVFGGATMLLQFTGGDKPGKYRPTLALLSDPDDTNSPDGSAYTFTIIVK